MKRKDELKDTQSNFPLCCAYLSTESKTGSCCKPLPPPFDELGLSHTTEVTTCQKHPMSLNICWWSVIKVLKSSSSHFPKDKSTKVIIWNLFRSGEAVGADYFSKWFYCIRFPVQVFAMSLIQRHCPNGVGGCATQNFLQRRSHFTKALKKKLPLTFLRWENPNIKWVPIFIHFKKDSDP